MEGMFRTCNMNGCEKSAMYQSEYCALHTREKANVVYPVRRDTSQYLLYLSTTDWSFKVRLFPRFALETTGNPTEDQIRAEYKRNLKMVEIEANQKLSQNIIEILECYKNVPKIDR